MIERIYDEKLIKEVVLTMIDDVIEDGTSHDCFELYVNADCWLLLMKKHCFTLKRTTEQL